MAGVIVRSYVKVKLEVWPGLTKKTTPGVGPLSFLVKVKRPVRAPPVARSILMSSPWYRLPPPVDAWFTNWKFDAVNVTFPPAVKVIGPGPGWPTVPKGIAKAG